ncbi:MAG: sulfotransferase [Bacteroidales bacterium]|nr:sulfotransferase [Bacteroidales bacterium]
MKDLIRCIILGPNRSGTTYLHTLLIGHPQISGIQEELRIDPLFTRGISTFTYGNEKTDDKAKGFITLFDSISRLNETENTKCSFIKMAVFNPFYLEKFIHTYHNNLKGVKLIISIREDLLAQYASQLRKNKTKIITVTSKSDSKNKGVKVRVSKPKLKKYVYNMMYMQKLMKHNLCGDVLFVSYEVDILNENVKLPEKVFKFLGVEHQLDVSWQNQFKISPDPEDYIMDYKNIRNFYQKLVDDLNKRELSDFNLSFSNKKLFRVKLLIKEILKVLNE